MCGFTFTVFLSVFQLLPTAPFHILDLGGSTFASGLFLGFLTYSSAFSAPLDGRLRGPRRPAPGAPHVERRHHDLLARLRAAPGPSVDAGDRHRPRHLLVGPAVGLRGVHDEPAAGAPAGGGHRLLGTLDRCRARGCADDRVLDLSPRLGVALRRVGGAEHHDGDHRVVPEGAARRRRRTSGPAACSSGACSRSR